jgi:hypothetical protein
MAEQVIFEGTFKTVKVDGGYDLILVTGEGKEVKEEKIGSNKQLVGCKKDAQSYAHEKDPKATHFKMIHVKPGRDKDAKETLSIKSKVS